MGEDQPQSSETPPPPEGGNGGATPRVSAALGFLQRRLERSAHLERTEWEPTVLFARTIRDDPKACNRDRIRASELIASLLERGIDVAEKFDKNERIDSGKFTENIGGKVQFIGGVDGGAV